MANACGGAWDNAKKFIERGEIMVEERKQSRNKGSQAVR
ncbi:MAG: hypothetical protein ACLTDV_00160 [Eubacterium sp.]